MHSTHTFMLAWAEQCCATPRHATSPTVVPALSPLARQPLCGDCCCCCCADPLPASSPLQCAVIHACRHLPSHACAGKGTPSSSSLPNAAAKSCTHTHAHRDAHERARLLRALPVPAVPGGLPRADATATACRAQEPPEQPCRQQPRAAGARTTHPGVRDQSAETRTPHSLHARFAPAARACPCPLHAIQTPPWNKRSHQNNLELLPCTHP